MNAQPVGNSPEAQFEIAQWEQYFHDELTTTAAGEAQSSLWWQLCNRDIFEILGALLRGDKPLKVLEAGCGSGETSIKLMTFHPNCTLTLLDGSESALACARRGTPPSARDRTTYVKGDVFEMPLTPDEFDLTWNCGLIEHYPRGQITQIIKEMMRVTAPGGTVAISIPNRKSIHVVKAWIIGTRFGRRWLKFIPGYRFTTEILYADAEIARLMTQAGLRDVKTDWRGSPLFQGASDRAVALADKFMRRSRYSFLSVYYGTKPLA